MRRVVWCRRDTREVAVVSLQAVPTEGFTLRPQRGQVGDLVISLE